MPMFNNIENENRFIGALDQIGYGLTQFANQLGNGALSHDIVTVGASIRAGLESLAEAQAINTRDSLEWARRVREEDVVAMTLPVNTQTVEAAIPGEVAQTLDGATVEVGLRNSVLTRIAYSLVRWETRESIAQRNEARRVVYLNAPFQPGTILCCNGRGCMNTFERMETTGDDWPMPVGWTTKTEWYEGPYVNTRGIGVEEIRQCAHNAHRIELFCSEACALGTEGRD